jgi:GT2 family glycosyltransferase
MDLSIITPTFNHRDYVEDLYRSLNDHSAGLKWEWFVADSGEDDTGRFLQRLADPRVHHIRIAHSGFGAINNELAARAKAPFLLFLNNDSRVTPGWWQGPLSLLGVPRISIVGSVLLNEDGTLQSVGMGLSTCVPFSYNFVSLPRWRNSSEGWFVPAITGACLFCSVSTFDALGGFDPLFEGGYYEDTDLCLRAYASGHMVAVAATSRVFHKARGSLDVSRAYWHTIPANRRAFGCRWQVVLRRLEGIGPLPLRPTSRESAVCINPWLKALGGGEREFIWAVNFLVRYCNNVIVCGADEEVRSALAERFSHTIPPGVAVEPAIRISPAHTIVWDQTYYDLKTSYTTSRRIHLKRVMFGPTRKPLARGPHFVFNSSYTRTSLRPTSSGTIIYPPVETDCFLASSSSLTSSKEKLVLNIGRFAIRRRYLNWKNQEALIRFFHRWRSGSDFRLVLAGNVNDESYLRKCVAVAESGPASSRIELHPDIPAAALRGWLRDSMFYVSFAGYERRTAAQAEHFGIAIVEAMAAGCVCLAYADGGHLEIIEHGVDGFLWNREAELARLLTRLTIDDDWRLEVAHRAKEKARQFAPMFAELQVRQILHQRGLSAC